MDVAFGKRVGKVLGCSCQYIIGADFSPGGYFMAMHAYTSQQIVKFVKTQHRPYVPRDSSIDRCPANSTATVLYSSQTQTRTEHLRRDSDASFSRLAMAFDEHVFHEEFHDRYSRKSETLERSNKHITFPKKYEEPQHSLSLSTRFAHPVLV